MALYEKIDLYNANAFSTYTIPGKVAKEIGLKRAARRAHLQDILIICTFGPMTDEEIKTWKPEVVLVDEKRLQ